MRAIAASKSSVSNQISTPLPSGRLGVADPAVVMLDFEIVQLQHEPVAADDPAIFRPGVGAATAEQRAHTSGSTPRRRARR